MLAVLQTDLAKDHVRRCAVTGLSVTDATFRAMEVPKLYNDSTGCTGHGTLLHGQQNGLESGSIQSGKRNQQHNVRAPSFLARETPSASGHAGLRFRFNAHRLGMMLFPVIAVRPRPAVFLIQRLRSISRPPRASVPRRSCHTRKSGRVFVSSPTEARCKVFKQPSPFSALPIRVTNRSGRKNTRGRVHRCTSRIRRRCQRGKP